MKFTELSIQNFLAIGEASISLEDRGLVLIQGANEDDTSANSNGSGKSSLADALCWVLYGVTARGVTGDGVVNNVTGKECKVSVMIEDGSATYRITRHRKHKTGKNGLVLQVMDKSTIEDLSLGTDKLTQERIERLIGCSLDVFKSAVYAGQEQMPDLPAMTDKQLKVLVEEAAGVTILESAYEEARARLSAIKTEESAVATRKDRALLSLANFNDNHLKAKESAEGWEISRRKYLDSIKFRLGPLAADINAHKVRLAALDVAKLEADIAASEAKLKGVDGERIAERKLLADIQTAERNVSSLQADARNRRLAADEYKAEIASVTHKIGCPCTSCGQEMTTAAIAPAQNALKTKARNVLLSLRDITARLDSALEARQKLTDALEAHRASMTDVTDESALSVSLRASLSGYRTMEAALAASKGDLHHQVELFREKKAELNPYEVNIADALAKIAKTEETIAEIEVDAATIAGKLTLAEVVAKVFSPAGVRAHILDDVTPFLNDQTAKYLSTLSDGNIAATWTTLVRNAKGELREKFSIEVSKVKGGETFAALSGGEKRKVRVAAALALQDLVARRATKPIELFIGDEIDDALDAAGLERLTTILEEKARERGSVFVISHHSLRDWISQVLVVTMKDGTARVEEVVS